jgi:hypothetical protein
MAFSPAKQKHTKFGDDDILAFGDAVTHEPFVRNVLSFIEEVIGKLNCGFWLPGCRGKLSFGLVAGSIAAKINFEIFIDQFVIGTR